MKTKLLTICLLLVTSQVFAKELQFYDCGTRGDDRDDHKSMVNATACNSNCKKCILVNEVNKKVLKLIPKNKYFDFTDLITLAIDKRYKVGLYPIDRSEWIDVGNLDHISRLNEIE